MIISAPGKLVLAGEYAVLEGYAGLVMAVGRRVVLTTSEHLSHSRLWEAVSQNQCEPRFKITSRALYEGMHKLGLGSSAAAAVCMAAYCSEKKKELHHPSKIFKIILSLFGLSENNKIYPFALEGHRRFSSGLGSGIDIAASYYGGLIRFQNGQATRLKPVFDAQSLLCVFTQKSQSTRAFLNRVSDYKAQKPQDFSQLMKNLGSLTPQWEAIYTKIYDRKILEGLVTENLKLLKQLSDKAKITLLTPEQEKIAQVCQKYQAVSKPSGAGGGDITLCFVPPENRQNLSLALIKLGFIPLDLDYFAPGLQFT